MFPGPEFWRNEQELLWDDLVKNALEVIQAGGLSGLKVLPAGIDQIVSFDQFSAAAIEFLRSYKINTVAGIADVTRNASASIIEQWITDGAPLKELEVRLTATGLFDAARAHRIAVTEVTRLFSTGNLIMWQTTGIVSAKKWQTARDERVCPLCGPLHGQIVETTISFETTAEDIAKSTQMRSILGGKFTEDLALQRAETLVRNQGTMSIAPPRHVLCRCWLLPVVDLEAFQRGLEVALADLPA